ncbi:MAG: hypothetical protein AAB439_00720 [Patescibacteria group bacterium]
MSPQKNIVSRLRAWWAWFRTQAESRHAPLAVAVWSFLNPLLVPFPAESLLAPIALANRKRAVFLTALASVMSTLGAGTGYLLAMFLFDAFVAPLVVGADLQAQLSAFTSAAGPLTIFWIVFIAALTLIPDPPFIAAAGLLHVDFFTFMIAFFLGRTLRFVLVIGVVLLFGRRAWFSFEKNEKRIALALFLLTILLGAAFFFFFT